MGTEKITFGKITINRNEIECFCQKWKVTRLETFGSVLRDDFTKESDIDILFSYQEDARISLFDLVNMKEELEQIFQRRVDLISRAGIERSKNPTRKKEILETARTFYVKAA